MTDILVHRPARRPVPPGPTTRVHVGAPPALADASGISNWTYALFPVLGSAGLLVIALINRNPLYLIAGAVFVLGSIGMGVAMFLQMQGRSRGQRFDERVRYFGHLAEARTRLREAADRQRGAARAVHPEPASLPGVVETPARLWERRPTDDDFLLLRVGSGRVPAAATSLLGEPDPSRPFDPAAEEAAKRLVATYATVADVPVAVPLRSGTTTLIGDGELARGVARAMLCQLAALHAPDDVRIAVCAPAGPAARAGWEWVKWLPHARHPVLDGDGDGDGDGGGGGDDGDGLLMAPDAEGLARLLHAEFERRRSSARAPGSSHPTAAAAGPALVVVVDGAVATPDPFRGVEDLGVAQLRLVETEAQEPFHVDLTLRLVAGSPEGGGPRVQPVVRDRGLQRAGLAEVADVHADVLSVVEAEVIARRLAPLQLSRRAGEVTLSEVSGLPELLGLDDVANLDPYVLWRRRPERQLLRVPIGVDGAGRPVELDLKESALSGMGPHGLVVGATGSGKSELLRTLVTGLAITHAPDELAMVLVDFKGGATFAELTKLPHVAGAITDLEDDPGSVERMGEALRGELRRREQLLRDSGNLVSIREHRQRRLAGADLEPMPHLLVVVDEFTELLVQQPDLIDLFVTIGRLGRSLGVHLLLSTQRLEEGRLRGLDSHLSYRLALRTFSAGESRSVIGNADAFELPPVPGSAYLKVDTSVYARLRVSTVSTPYVDPGRRRRSPVLPRPRAFRAFGDGGDGGDGGRAGGAALPAIGLDLSDPDRRSTLGVVVARLAEAAEPVHQVWLPPLPAALPLSALLPGLRIDPERGVTAAPPAPLGQLRAPLGLIDLPEQQRQQVFGIDLSGAGGSVGLAGAPRTGKSTLLRTLVTSLAVTHTPAELQVYCLDLGGGGLTSLEALPHVGGVAGRASPERMRRMVAQLTGMLDDRERRFGEQRIESPPDFRARVARGELPGDGHGDVLLVVDGWAALRSEFEDLEQAITALATRGLAYGLHVVITANRWLDLRPALKDSLGTKLELRLGEPADSVFDRASARALPPDVPGRLLVRGGRKVQVALPHLSATVGVDGVEAPGEPEEPERTARRLREHWHGPAAPPILLLPTSVSVDELPRAGADREPGVPIGLRESDLRPAYLDLLTGRDPHLLVVGDAGSGKTAALRTLIRGLTARCTPQELLVVVVDYRRTLLDAVDEAHLSRYCGAAPAAAGTLQALGEKLAARLPGPDITPAQLRARDWWSGPRALVVVDDYDLVAVPGGDPLSALVDLLPMGRDIGLHLVVARAAGGVTAAGMQPVLRRVRELGSQGLLLSGPREEGAVLHGARLQPLPPGRAQHVVRSRPAVTVQLAWTPEGMG